MGYNVLIHVNISLFMIVFQSKMRTFGFESTIPFQTFYAKNGEQQNKNNDN